MRTKKRSALLTPSLVLEVASHTVMGVALGLGFAFALTHFAPFGVLTLIDHSAAPDDAVSMLMDTCATTFGIGATLTGLVFTTTKDHPS
jgi:hypothetical protein